MISVKGERGLLITQAEKEHNTLLDECDKFREDMGEITDNISLETALETIRASRKDDAIIGTCHDLMLLSWFALFMLEGYW